LEASEILEVEDALIPSAEQSRGTGGGAGETYGGGGERYGTMFFLGENMGHMCKMGVFSS